MLLENPYSAQPFGQLGNVAVLQCNLNGNALSKRGSLKHRLGSMEVEILKLNKIISRIKSEFVGTNAIT